MAQETSVPAPALLWGAHAAFPGPLACKGYALDQTRGLKLFLISISLL